MDTRVFATAIEFVTREVGYADEGLRMLSLEDRTEHRQKVSLENWLEVYEQVDDHELMVDSGCFGHV